MSTYFTMWLPSQIHSKTAKIVANAGSLISKSVRYKSLISKVYSGSGKERQTGFRNPQKG